MAQMRTSRYPVPGTMADKILQYIQKNPGVSVSAIVRALDLNPSPARTCLKNLLDKDKIVDTPNSEGHHSYSVKGAAF